MQKIEPEKLYTLNEIVNNGLLLQRNAKKPITTLNMARRIVMSLGYKSEFVEGLQQVRWRVPGKALIAYNEQIKEAV